MSSQSQGLVLPPSAAVPEAKKKLYQHLYFQVLCAIVIGILLGHFYPSLGESMKPLGDGFIKLIKMLIAPIIFFTVVHGIASTGDLKKVGRVGIKALIYFEVMTTLALAIGYISMKLVEPGVGMNVDPSTLDATAIQGFTAKAKEQGIIEYLMHIIPSTVVGAFAEGDILQVLLLAILFAFALQFMGERGKPLLAIIDTTSHAFFGMVGIVMKVAPLGAFGAMAFTIGKYGIVSLLSLGQLLVAFYATCFIFVFVVLGGVAHLTGFSLWRFLKYIKEELLLVLGTSSSEIGAAPVDRQVRSAWLREVGGRACRSVRLFLQSRRQLHHADDDGDLCCPGHEHVTQLWARNWPSRRAAPHLQGRGRCDGRSLHCSRRDTRLDWHDPGRRPGSRSRRVPLHIGGRVAGEPDR